MGRNRNVVAALITKLQLLIAAEREPVERGEDREPRITYQDLGVGIAETADTATSGEILREQIQFSFGFAISLTLGLAAVPSLFTSTTS